MASPLVGIKVLDLTKVFSGPYATRLLADYGADVVKIEHPDFPDDSRQFPPLVHGVSGYFELLNRNKKGITLDLKNTAALEHFYQLCQEADVVVENFLPSVKKRLKIDYETIVRYRTDIIYASLAGINQTEDRRYYDVIAQAESGLASLTTVAGEPVKIGPAIVDAFSGLKLAFAIASALYSRSQTGLGQQIDVSMLGGAFDLLEQNLIETSITERNPLPAGNQDTAISPFGFYRTGDGMIALGVGNDGIWKALDRFLSAERGPQGELYATNAERLEHNEQLTQWIESVFAGYTTSELVQRLQEIGVPCGPVKTMQDLINSHGLFEQDLLRHVDHPVLGVCVMPTGGIRFSEQPEQLIRPAPRLGEHNDNL